MKKMCFYSLFFLAIISCTKNKDDINMSLLHSYYYVDSQVNENQNTIKNNDTVRLSFEDSDTVKMYYYHYGSGQVLNKVESGYKKYFVENNKISFAWFVDNLQGIDYGLTTGTWDIQVLNSDTLIVNSYSPSGEILSHFGYSTKKK
jgi:hypothetical protein